MARRPAAPAPAPPTVAQGAGGAGGPVPAPAAPSPGAGGGDASSGGRSSSRFNQSGFGPTAGGVVLGAFAVVLFVQYSRGGPAQVKAWLSAKFLNNAGSVGAAADAIGKGAQALGQGVTLGATGSGGQSGADSGGSAPSSPPTNKQGLQ